MNEDAQTLAAGASDLRHTDPELVEYFDNFAFGEVVAHCDLDTRTHLLVQLGATQAGRFELHQDFAGSLRI